MSNHIELCRLIRVATKMRELGGKSRHVPFHNHQKYKPNRPLTLDRCWALTCTSFKEFQFLTDRFLNFHMAEIYFSVLCKYQCGLRLLTISLQPIKLSFKMNVITKTDMFYRCFCYSDSHLAVELKLWIGIEINERQTRYFDILA